METRDHSHTKCTSNHDAAVACCTTVVLECVRDDRFFSLSVHTFHFHASYTRNFVYRNKITNAFRTRLYFRNWWSRMMSMFVCVIFSLSIVASDSFIDFSYCNIPHVSQNYWSDRTRPNVNEKNLIFRAGSLVRGGDVLSRRDENYVCAPNVVYTALYHDGD